MIILTATDGMVYTNGQVYAKEIYLGVNDSPENWYEVTEEEAAAAEEEELEDVLSE